ncbi:hypothetical protein [Petrimonas sp.]|uniref:hypothetical protein n=1 Tax=Petrimonas sp. TaxID=2023866 RepID=UPI002FCB4737
MEHRTVHPVGVLPVEIPARLINKLGMHQAGCKGFLPGDQQPLVDALLLGRIKREVRRQYLPREDHREEQRVVEDGVPERQPLERGGVEQVIGQLERPVLFSKVDGVQQHGSGFQYRELRGIPLLHYIGRNWHGRLLDLPLLDQLLYVCDAFKKLQGIGNLSNGFRYDKRSDQKNEKQTKLFHNCIIRHSFSVLKAKIKRIVEIPPMREKCNG